MRITFFSNAVAVVATVLVSLAFAGVVDRDNAIVRRQFPPDPKVLGPFNLITSSQNKAYDKLAIFGRHIGAGINLAVVGAGTPIPFPKSRYYTYYLNTTYGFPPDPSDPGSTASGSLVYPVFEPNPYAFTASLSYNSSSNIAQLWLAVVGPSYEFGFDSKGRLGLRGIYDRWFVCPKLQTPYGPLQGVAWRLGTGKIDDKDCVPIEIIRYDFLKN